MLHEFFFDPITVGSAIAADASNGVLKPATFTDADGASATVESIAWEAGRVKVKVVPWSTLSGHVLDFIELDGRVSLSLSATNSMVHTADDTFVWSVGSQPWEDGDKLMVRIRTGVAAIASPPSTPTPTAASASIATRAPTSLPPPTSTPTPTPAPENLTQEIPPCTPISGSSVDPCEPDVKVRTSAVGGVGSGGIFEYDQPQTVRAFLDGAAISFIPHIVLRGTYIPDTARCTSGNPVHVPSYVEPGYFQHSILFQCFADVRVNSYVLGEGPERLTVQVSFRHYWDGYYASVAASDNMTEQEGVEFIRAIDVLVLEQGSATRDTAGIYGREVVLFIGPAHSHAIEVWEVFEIWDVQREDGTIIAVHPHRDDWRAARPDDYQTYRSQLEMELPAFTQAVTAANQARVTEYGGRIAPKDIPSRAEGVDLPMLVTDANRLRQYYTDTGAYGHPDGPPAQPPPVPTCLGRPAVSDPRANAGMVRDCTALLDGKDTLRGTATLNWSVDTSIANWEGITTGNTPSQVFSQVIKVELPNKSLNGSIPSSLGALFGLTHLDLSGNSLTGEIPVELGLLTKLEALKLGGNSLTGCIPAGLRNVSDSDLGRLGLAYCAPSS